MNLLPKTVKTNHTGKQCLHIYTTRPTFSSFCNVYRNELPFHASDVLFSFYWINQICRSSKNIQSDSSFWGTKCFCYFFRSAALSLVGILIGASCLFVAVRCCCPGRLVRPCWGILLLRGRTGEQVVSKVQLLTLESGQTFLSGADLTDGCTDYLFPSY